MQKHTTCLTRHLPKAGVKVDLYYLRDEKHPSEEVTHSELFDGDADIQVHAVRHPRRIYFPGHYYWTCLLDSVSLYRALRNSGTEYDFIYAQGYTGWYAMLAKKCCRESLPPIGVHGHGLEALQEDRNVWWYLTNTFAPVWQEWNLRLADCNLSLGGRLNDLIVAATGPRATILPAYNGIDDEWLRPADDIRDRGETVRFLFVGRDSERKGLLELNEAVKQMVTNPRFEIHLVGSIAPSRRILAPNVIYHNEVRDERRLRDLYRTCDVLVCPSYSEGMPTVILEAMASGLAIIATDVGAVRVLVDGEVGDLIPARDSAALLDAMRSALTRNILAKKRAARERVEDFTWTKVTATFVNALRASLNDRPPAAGTA